MNAPSQHTQRGVALHGDDLGSDGTQRRFRGLRDGQRVQYVVTLAQLMLARALQHRFVLPQWGVFGEIQGFLIVVQIVQNRRTKSELYRQVSYGSRFSTGYNFDVPAW